jgi:hypothetical protein
MTAGTSSKQAVVESIGGSPAAKQIGSGNTPTEQVLLTNLTETGASRHFAYVCFHFQSGLTAKQSRDVSFV